MISYGRQNLNRSDRQAVDRVLRSNFLTQGPEVEKFEKALAKELKVKYVVAASNGTAALHLAYLASGLKPGDEVITSPNTFVATTNMLLAVGARPVFSDIRLDTYNLDEKKLETLISEKTQAIVLVDFAGHPCAMDKIRRLAKKHRLLVITDSSHSLGATYHGKSVAQWSDLVTLSFHPVKLITTGEGGAIGTNNKKIYERLKLLRSHGIHKDKNGFNVMTEFGYNYRLTDFQAALGTSQLNRLKEFLVTRHKIASWYQELLSGCEEIILPKELARVYSGWHLYVIRVKRRQDRLPLMNHLRSNGVGINFHYPLVYTHPYYRKLGYQNTHLPAAEEYHHTAITLPLHTKLTHNQVKQIARLIKEFFKKQ